MPLLRFGAEPACASGLQQITQRRRAERLALILAF
jgi:hypothetical protein